LVFAQNFSHFFLLFLHRIDCGRFHFFFLLHYLFNAKSAFISLRLISLSLSHAQFCRLKESLYSLKENKNKIK
jgi:hypothetical protein